MSDAPQTGELSPLKRALLELRTLRARVADLESRAREPLAIVGMSVRAPGGVTTLGEFERLLWSGTDAITDVPGERWSLADWFDANADVPGKMSTRHGGFLGDVQGFDADLFGIAPAEAASMDPQQRLALELAWEAIEHAGIAPSALAGSRTGVYLGIANSDYGRRLFARPDRIDPYFSSGTAFSVAAGRIAYVLDLRGPAVAVDTACSSSLVALHLACQALRQGDCDYALVGGVNLMLSPELSVNFSKAGMMSPDGRCRTFDASANGYVRGEGGGFVLLRRRADAEAAGDRVLALIRGTAVNQDGRSNGLTAPNGPAQQAVITAALDAADIAPAHVGYVEAHGTGTPLGDPIEVGALAAVLADGRSPETPLMLGSVKTNVGHLEAAAGVAGLIKTVLALGRREIPPHLHLTTPNPLVDWDTLPLTVPTSITPWAPIDGRWIAGISSFGFSGTNAHAIVEAATTEESTSVAAPDRGVQLLALSARHPRALTTLAEQYRQFLNEVDASGGEVLRDICCTAAVGRNHFAHRLSITASSVAELSDTLSHWLDGTADARAVAGSVMEREPRVAFLFSGQGAQYAQMGRELYAGAPAFRRAFDECGAAFAPYLDRSLTSILYPQASDDTTPLERTEYVQPAMFAIEYALAALWRSWGVEPVAVMGHSFGEYAAAAVAGVVSLADAARMVAARGRLVSSAPGDGAMTILEASDAEVAAAIRESADRVSIAAVNGPANVVISGDRRVVETIAARFVAQGRRATPLRIAHAFHSPLMDPVLDRFERELDGVQFHAAQTTVISNVTGGAAGADTLGRARYWRDHLRQPVRFAESIQALADKGVTHYIEIGPHPVLLGMGAECITGGTWLPSLRQGQPAWSELLRSLQSLYADGQRIDWAGVAQGQPYRRVALPTYPFQRRRHWIDEEQASSAGQNVVDAWSSLVRRLDREAERGPLDLNPATYPEKWESLDRLTTGVILHTLVGLGAFVRAGERHTLDSLLRTTGIIESHRRLVLRWLEDLTSAGVLVRDRDAYTVVSDALMDALPALWRDAEERFADNREYLAYVRHCADHLSAIVTGRESALESLFPGGSFDLATALYERSATMRYANGLAAAALEAAAYSASTARPLRILEIGGGTGGTTSALLASLPADRVRYRFTDVSELFLDTARARFAAYPSFDTSVFDLEIDPAAQGYAAGSVDLVVSANAVHAVRDLPAALERLRGLLAPGGLLVLVETTTHHRHFEITTGLIEGWQHFADSLRTDVPLLAPQQWTSALREAGFVEASAWPRAEAVQSALTQHVIVARAPGSWVGSADAASTAEAAAAVDDGHLLPQETSPAESYVARIAAALPAERFGLLIDLVRGEVMRILRLGPDEQPRRDERLMELGMDSLMAIQLRNALNRATDSGSALPATLMFDYPTIEAIAGFLLEQLEPREHVHPVVVPVPTMDEAREAPLTAVEIATLSDDEIADLLLDREGRR
jgi:acyl transferase domain-containing protein/SAM-dependent methyltransferase